MTPLLLSLALGGFLTDTISYGPDAKQKADVYRKDDAKDLPVVIFFHGGVWQLGDRSQYKNVGYAFASRGFVAVVASYRLAPAFKYPAQIDDAAALVALVKQQAKQWGGNPDKLFLVGHSAGAQLAMVLLYDPAHLQKQKLQPSDIDGVVAVSGVFDLRAALDEDQDDGGRARFITPVFGTDLQTLRAASPLDVVKKTGTPLLFLTGTEDYAAMRAQTEAMRRALLLLGEKTPVIVVDARDHFQLVTEIGQPGDRTTDEIVRFLRK